ncbi:hypothetical protein GCM10023155_49010 [Bremerella cremea]
MLTHGVDHFAAEDQVQASLHLGIVRPTMFAEQAWWKRFKPRIQANYHWGSSAYDRVAKTI